MTIISRISFVVAIACVIAGVVFLILGSWSGIAMLINAATFTLNGFSFSTAARMRSRAVR